MSAREMFETICGKKLNCDENDENAVDLLDKVFIRVLYAKFNLLIYY